ncbi:MAG: carotenoid biosynthesis protein [Saprospiraceae bacterium]|nr:carotenoid biosynthesis protein [Saprospiraceae bacterium]MDW8484203.1 carotenoid biosynthesis protein [Saprospiraceae bacterium]
MIQRLSYPSTDLLLNFCAIVYLLGIVGMLSPAKPWFVSQTPVSLLLSYFTLLFFHSPHTRETTVYFLCAFIVGFGIEIVGVNTGWPFGHYEYGSVLGPKVASTPLLIGINWTLVTYCSFYALEQLLPRLPHLVFAPLAAVLPVGLDFLIEPVAIHFGMWSWPSTGLPPLENYVGWYTTSLILAIIWRLVMPHSLQNRAALMLLGLQIFFFAVLGLLISLRAA